MVVGVDYGKVEQILTELDQEITALSQSIEDVTSTSTSITDTFSSEAGTAFQTTMSDYVKNAEEAIPVLESIRKWVEQTAAEYEAQDKEIASKFTLN